MFNRCFSHGRMAGYVRLFARFYAGFGFMPILAFRKMRGGRPGVADRMERSGQLRRRRGCFLIICGKNLF